MILILRKRNTFNISGIAVVFSNANQMNICIT